MSQQKYKEYLDKVPAETRNLVEFLLSVEGQEYGNELMALRMGNFQIKTPGKNAEPPILVSGGFTRYHKQLYSDQQETQFGLKRELSRSYNEAFKNALERGTSDEALRDYNRSNYFGPGEFTTVGKAPNKGDLEEVAGMVEKWVNQDPNLALNVLCIQCEFIARSEENNAFFVTTKEGKIEFLQDDRKGSEKSDYEKFVDHTAHFFKEINEDKKRFNIEGKGALTLSEMLASGIRRETIFSKIKEEMSKDTVLSQYQPHLFMMMNMEIDPNAPNERKSQLTAFTYERSPFLKTEEELKKEEALDFLEENKDFFGAPFNSKVSQGFQEWAKSLQSPENRAALGFVHDLNQRLIEVGGRYHTENLNDEYKNSEYKNWG